MPLDAEAVAVFDENQKILAANIAPKTSRGLHDGEVGFAPRQGAVLCVVVTKKGGQP